MRPGRCRRASPLSWDFPRPKVPPGGGLSRRFQAHADQRERADPARAEFALLIVDAWQGAGLGGRLVDELLAHVRSRGVTTLTGALLMSNQRMLRLVRRHAPDALIRQQDGECEVTINLGEAAV